MKPYFEAYVTPRNFSYRPLVAMDGVILVPNTVRKSVIGGPVEASITCHAPVEKLFELVSCLRCPVLINDMNGNPVWWGMVEEVQVRLDAVEMGVSVRHMSNKIRIEYNALLPGQVTAGDRYVTDSVQESVSVATYGTKELIATLTDALPETANQYRDTLLSQRKWPIPIWYLSGSEMSMSATLVCTGWWKTLGWCYYENNSGYAAYRDSGEGVQTVGKEAANEMAAQSFVVPGTDTWEAHTIKVRLRKAGSPSDNVIVELCANNAGVPGTVLASAQATAVNIPTDYNWVNFELSAQVALSLATTYWVKVRRSGANDATHHYLTDVNQELGYTDGAFKKYNSGVPAWETRSPDADMLFEVIGVTQTTDQLTKLYNACGQFLTGISIETASGVYRCPFRDGSVPGLEEAEELLKIGTSNDRRLLAEVTAARLLRIYEEPVRPSTFKYSLLSNGRVLREPETLLDQWLMPVGQWISTERVIPPTLNTVRIADPTAVFVEEFEFDLRTFRGMLYPRSVMSPWDVGMQAPEDAGS